MTDIALASGLVARASFASDAGSRVPRQEWLGPARQTNRSTDQEDAGESTPLRLVGHKVLAQGAGRGPRNWQDPAAADSAEIAPTLTTDLPQVYSTSTGSSTYAARAIASFSQQLRGNLAAKGTRINTYA
jgi:hypothetical protein